MLRCCSVLALCALWQFPAWSAEITSQDQTAIRNLATPALESYFQTGDADRLVDVMPDKAVAYLGGREEIRRSFRASSQSLQKFNPRYKDLTILDCKSPFMAGDTTLCIARSTVTLVLTNSEMRMVGFLIASRDKGSDRWQILGGSDATKHAKALPVIYPGFPEGLELPPIGFAKTF